jgi:hypothetical protein
MKYAKGVGKLKKKKGFSKNKKKSYLGGLKTNENQKDWVQFWLSQNKCIVYGQKCVSFLQNLLKYCLNTGSFGV